MYKNNLVLLSQQYQADCALSTSVGQIQPVTAEVNIRVLTDLSLVSDCK